MHECVRLRFKYKPPTYVDTPNLVCSRAPVPDIAPLIKRAAYVLELIYKALRYSLQWHCNRDCNPANERNNVRNRNARVHSERLESS
jgi:hypothetical protein